MRRVAISLGVGAALLALAGLAAGCGDGPDVAPTPTVYASPTPMVVKNAALMRDSLLEIGGKATWDTRLTTEGFGVFTGWRAAYPSMAIYTPASPATTGRISVYADVLNPSYAASSKNPQVVVFAVTDTQGKCEAGALSLGLTPPKIGRLVLTTTTCTGDAAAAELRASQSAGLWP